MFGDKNGNLDDEPDEAIEEGGDGDDDGDDDEHSDRDPPPPPHLEGSSGTLGSSWRNLSWLEIGLGGGIRRGG